MSNEVLSYRKSTDSTSTVDSSRNRQRKDRRTALKEYYKLKKKTEEEQKKAAANTEDEDRGSSDDKLRNLSDEDIKKLVEDGDIKELLTLENQVHYKINTNKSLIKNIIYNNYFELIRINSYLSDIVVKEDAPLYEVNSNSEEEDDDIIVTNPNLTSSNELTQLKSIIESGEAPKAKTNPLDSVKELHSRLKSIRGLSAEVGEFNFVKN